MMYNMSPSGFFTGNSFVKYGDLQYISNEFKNAVGTNFCLQFPTCNQAMVNQKCS